MMRVESYVPGRVTTATGCSRTGSDFTHAGVKGYVKYALQRQCRAVLSRRYDFGSVQNWTSSSTKMCAVFAPRPQVSGIYRRYSWTTDVKQTHGSRSLEASEGISETSSHFDMITANMRPTSGDRLVSGNGTGFWGEGGLTLQYLARGRSRGMELVLLSESRTTQYDIPTRFHIGPLLH
jgi:hypothetical protein